MADAKKQDRWLDVKDAMSVRPLTLGPQTAAAANQDPTALVLQLSFYKVAAKLIGRGKRAVVADCGEGIGAWVIAKECGFALGLDADEAALASARDNFTSDMTAFAKVGGGFPPGPWHALVRFLGGGAKDLPDWQGQAASRLEHDGLLVLGTDDSTAATALRARLEPQFHHVFVFCESLGIVPDAAGKAASITVVVGCRPRR